MEVPLSPPSFLEERTALLEAILFVAEDVVPLSAIQSATGARMDEIEEALDALEQRLERRGVRLQRLPRGVQLVTAPAFAPWVERFLGLELESRLSTAALEALSIVAYGQPITRAEIEAVRGVQSSGVLRTLIQRDLIEELGRLESVGHPYLYGTTPAFLQYFGLASLDELPPLEPGAQTHLLTTLAAERRQLDEEAA